MSPIPTIYVLAFHLSFWVINLVRTYFFESTILAYLGGQILRVGCYKTGQSESDAIVAHVAKGGGLRLTGHHF